MPDWQRVAALLADAGVYIDPETKPRAIAGGDINAAWRVPTREGSIFLKSNAPVALGMFRAEHDALLEIAATDTVRVPRPLVVCGDDNLSFLALEWLNLESAGSKASRLLGRQLAALHRHTAPTFGWQRDNTIGRTPQPNPRSDSWLTFFREHRLMHQLRIAAGNGHDGELQAAGRWLCENIAALFTGYEPEPSLLHGDLWGGNWAAIDDMPVMFDPATYYGDRETDLAMTRLFGGFTEDFYNAYAECWPLSPGAPDRQGLYQLYHVLNHLNLFGGGYATQALSLMAQLRGRIERFT